MSSRFRPPARENDRPAGCWVGLLEPQCLVRRGRDYGIYLSAAERERDGVLRSPKRRLEWLAGRLAAKYLFLHRLEMGFPNEGQQWRPTLLQLSAESLDAFPARMYQAIELSPSTDPQCGGPGLRWCGRTMEESVSISHAGNNACACLSAGGTVGVDLEIVAPRVEAFYRSNYTETEKHWVNRSASIEPFSQDWLYTLLWTFKEAALKARAVLQKNSWSFAGVGVSGLPISEDVLWVYRKSRWGDQFGLFTALIEESGKGVSVQIAYSGTSHVILTVLKQFGH
jgi:phosphopantetheinyl transferase (holo-ACP synthase)